MMKKKYKFSIGDEVDILGTNTVGTIKDYSAYMGDDNNLYVVSVYGRERIYSESNLSLLRKKNVACLIDAKDLSIRLEIQEKINSIIEELDLKTPADDNEALENACSLHAYLATSFDYVKDESVAIGKNVNLNTLYHGLIYGESDFFTSTYIFSEVLKKINMDVLNVAMIDENGDFYVSNLVLIGRRYFFFDVNLEKDIYSSLLEENPDAPFEFTCAGLGKESYYKFFTPLAIINYRKPLKSPCILPFNISASDISLDFLNLSSDEDEK